MYQAHILFTCSLNCTLYEMSFILTVEFIASVQMVSNTDTMQLLTCSYVNSYSHLKNHSTMFKLPIKLAGLKRLLGQLSGIATLSTYNKTFICVFLRAFSSSVVTLVFE